MTKTLPLDAKAPFDAASQGAVDFVMLIDDQPMVGEAIRRIVAEMDGFDFHYVADPMVALETACNIAPSVILLDLMMPHKDGVTLLREMRQHPALANVPVIMLSTTESAQTKALAFEAGTDDYLVKIPEANELQARLRYHSRAHKTRLQRDDALHSLRESQRRLQVLNLRLLQLSQVDGLTGLSNRRHFDDVLAMELRRSVRHRDPLTLVMLDLDHFKSYNDRYGHLQGDDCLRRVAAVLARAARRPGDLAARYGGEEFALILPHCDAAGGESVAQAVQHALSMLSLPHEATARAQVTLSQGIATSRPGVETGSEALIRRADLALYRAKHGGRDRYCAATD